MSALKILKIISMSHESLCRSMCIPKYESNIETIDKMYQKRARLGYVLWIFIIGIFCQLTKTFAVDMFYYLYNSLNCNSNTYMNSCFSLVMIYRLTWTIFLYHFILMCLNGGRSKASNFINDFIWPIKLIIFAQIFFISCLVSNDSMKFIAMIFKWVSMVFLVFKVILLNDSLFFYFNKNRFQKLRGFGLCWNISAYVIGISFFLMGFALFMFCFSWYNHLCTDYKVITSIYFIVGWLIIISNAFLYKFKVGINQSFVFFFFISLINFGNIAATPYTTCINLLNQNFVYSTASMHIDTVSGLFIRFFDADADPIFFGK